MVLCKYFSQFFTSNFKFVSTKAVIYGSPKTSWKKIVLKLRPVSFSGQVFTFLAWNWTISYIDNNSSWSLNPNLAVEKISIHISYFFMTLIGMLIQGLEFLRLGHELKYIIEFMYFIMKVYDWAYKCTKLGT